MDLGHGEKEKQLKEWKLATSGGRVPGGGGCWYTKYFKTSNRSKTRVIYFIICQFLSKRLGKNIVLFK
jgi:hypothetical protein